MPKVHNKYHNNYPINSVYIGRPTEWGNPFSHLENSRDTILVPTRDDAVNHYHDWLMGHLVIPNIEPPTKEKIKLFLKGKDLVCWCAPKACHGDILLKIANEV